MSEINNALGHGTVDADGIATLTMKMEGRANKINETFIRGFAELVAWLQSLETLTGVIVASGHRDFCVGADLDFMYVETDPARILEGTQILRGSFRTLETLDVPVVAALTGSALGGGYELAQACHRRIAIDRASAQYGLPEVMFGLIPGGGGTQRLPRLIGFQAALELMAQGSMLRAPAALKKGLVHELQPNAEAILAAARAWIVANPKSKQPWDQRGFTFPGGVQPNTEDSRNLFSVAAAMLYKKTAGAFRAPEVLMQVVQEGSRLTFDRAVEIEARAFAALVVSDQAKDMMRTFWYHRTAAEKQKGLPTAEADNFSQVAILGAGMMGAGLAFIAAKRGYQVVLKDISQEALDKGMAHCAAQAKKLRHLDDAARQEILGRINATLALDDLKGTDLVIEAVFEDLDLKHRVIREVEPLLADGAIFASNTSALPITDLAKASQHPERFIGLHFFSPVEKMPLIEIICGAQTDEDTLSRCLAFAAKLPKTAIVVNDGYGFYTSRVFSAYILEGAQLVAEGHDPKLIEWGAREQGMVVPPLQVFDEVTLKLGAHAMSESKKYLKVDLDLPGRDLVYKMVELGRLGKAHGAGFYDYKGSKRRGLWSGLAGLAVGTPSETGIDVISRRLMLIQAAEVARCLDGGILRSYRDAEVGAIFGIGFAPSSGGPLAWMDRQGLDNLVNELREAATKWGARYEPAPILVKMAKEGTRFFAEGEIPA